MHPAIGLLIGYLSGSIPFAYLAGRLVKGIDLRTLGSGNLGATNVFRTLGWPYALVVLLLDGAKGGLPAYWLPRLLDAGPIGSEQATWWALAYGAAAIIGHAKPIFLLWRGGGKGVATAAGVFAVVSFGITAATFAICIVAVAATGYMSVGSVVAAICIPLFAWFTQGASPLFWVGSVICLFVVWMHRVNFQRLRDGTEHRLWKKKSATGDAS